jgi:hypothetical protein
LIDADQQPTVFYSSQFSTVNNDPWLAAITPKKIATVFSEIAQQKQMFEWFATQWPTKLQNSDFKLSY